ncbi:hypothetical protein RZE82_08785 [Mollicutes bacterium LVI A0039]|nr:hypothetical protein RZE82_08785 [Mollicutes bacterium LVI A0039]
MNNLYDEVKRNKLVKVIEELSTPDNYITVDVDEFFDGNNDLGSIGCNLYPVHPGLEVFYNTLKKLESHDDVDNFQVVICDVDEGSWPYSELIYVYTKLDIEQVTQIVAHLEPDDIWHA